jgi:hypothetical protein
MLFNFSPNSVIAHGVQKLMATPSEAQSQKPPRKSVGFLIDGCLNVSSVLWFVSATISDKASLLVVWFKWPVSIGSGIHLFAHKQIVAGVVALAWPLFAGVLTPPGKVGVIELRLAKRIGYIPPDAEI